MIVSPFHLLVLRRDRRQIKQCPQRGGDTRRRVGQPGAVELLSNSTTVQLFRNTPHEGGTKARAWHRAAQWTNVQRTLELPLRCSRHICGQNVLLSPAFSSTTTLAVGQGCLISRGMYRLPCVSWWCPGCRQGPQTHHQTT